MAGIFEILEKIKARPGMYIGRPSVSDLFMFLVGYEAARSELGIEPTDEENDFYGEFQPWLQERFDIMTVRSWATMIMFCCRDEKEGFEYFYKLLDEFKERDKSLDGKREMLVKKMRQRAREKEEKLAQVEEEIKQSVAEVG